MPTALDHPTPARDSKATSAAGPSARAGALTITFAVGVLCAAIGSVWPLVSPLLVAMGLGIVAVNIRGTRGARADQIRISAESCARWALRSGIVMLGFKLSATQVLDVGLRGLLIIVISVAITFTATRRIGQRMGLDHGLVTLIATGFSICGAAAIGAVATSSRAAKKDVGLSLALVTVYGTAMVAVIPAVAHLAGLSDHDAALWAGVSIHEIAQVVVVGSILGPTALATATATKLARVMLLAPVAAVVARTCAVPEASTNAAAQDTATRAAAAGIGVIALTPASESAPALAPAPARSALVPWFVVGFAAAVALRSTGLLPDVFVDVAAIASTVLLAAGMFGLGLAVRLRDLWPLPGRAIALGAIATGLIAGISLTLIFVLA